MRTETYSSGWPPASQPRSSDATQQLAPVDVRYTAEPDLTGVGDDDGMYIE